MYRNMAPNVATHPTPLIDYIRAGSRSTVGMDFGIFILFYFSILIVCRSPVAHLHFFSILQFYFHRTVVRPAAICSDFTTYSCAVFASSLTPILCSCAVNGISIKCAICLCPRGATLLILQSSIPPIPHIASHAREPTYNPSMFRFPSLCSLPSPYIRLHHFMLPLPVPAPSRPLLCSLQHLRPLASTCLTLLLVSICSILVLFSQLTYLVQPHLARCHALVLHTVLS